MDWRSLLDGMQLTDDDYPERTHRLLALSRVLDGTQYDHLPHAFSDERSPGGEYIPLKHRRPSVRTHLCRVVVDDVVSLLFGDGHFPTILTDDEATREALADIIDERRLNLVMMKAATRGSVGSACIRLRVLKQKPHFDVLSTEFLTPEWFADDPDRLERITEKYKVPAKRLKALGYTVDEDAGDHWFQRIWDVSAETWFLPWPVSEHDREPVVDTRRTLTHGLGFVPMIWIKNLPGADDIDGDSTFARAIDTVVELDYLMSQAGRGLKYSSDPTLVLKGQPDDTEGHKGGAATALVVPPEGDAKLLEINGSAAGAVLNHARELRSAALELMHGNRAHPDKMTAAQSGRAMELLNQGLIWLAGRLRVAYGDGALHALFKMVAEASVRVKGGLIIQGKPQVLDVTGLALKWPAWYPPSADDRFAEINALNAGIVGGVVSRETAVHTAMEFYQIDDFASELARIKKDMDEADSRAKQQAKDQADAKPKPAKPAE